MAPARGMGTMMRYGAGLSRLSARFVLVVATVSTLVVLTGSASPASRDQRVGIDISALGLASGQACGEAATTFRPATSSPEHVVFRMDGSWHRVRMCLRHLLRSARRQGGSAPIHDFIYRQVLYALSPSRVRFRAAETGQALHLADIVDSDGAFDPVRFDRIAYVNKKGLSYNSMLQVDLGMALLSAGRQYLSETQQDRRRAEIYLALGLALFGVVTDPVEDGGLRARGRCGLRPEYRCSWFHAVTYDALNDARAGATLNKNLTAVRELYRGAKILKEIGGSFNGQDLQRTADRLAVAAIEGVNQLAYGGGNRTRGAPPNLIDFIPKTADGRPVQNSWLYYAVNPMNRKGYFLTGDDVHRNCSYHGRDINLMHAILTRLGDRVDLSGLVERNELLGASILGFIVGTHRMKLRDGGLYVDSETAGEGNFAACRKGYKKPPREAVLQYLTDLTADG